MLQKLLIILSLILFSNFALANQPIEEYRSEIINNRGKKIGELFLKQGIEGVVIRIKAKGLKAGAHGMYFHDSANCKEEPMEIDPSARNQDHTVHNEIHGFFNPDGPRVNDLPNLMVGHDGSASTEIYSNFVSISGQAWKPELRDEDGSSLMIFETEDDHFSQPNGNAGRKIACAIIAPIASLAVNNPIDNKGEANN